MTTVLSGLATHEHSKVAFTTRDKKFESDIPVTSRKRNEKRSKKILLSCAGLKTGPTSFQEREAMNSVLRFADGLRIALNVIWKQAQYIRSTYRLNENNIWSRVYREYQRSKQVIHEVVFDIDKDQGREVFVFLLASLDMIATYSTDNASRDRFAQLCILRKRQEVPLDT